MRPGIQIKRDGEGFSHRGWIGFHHYRRYRSIHVCFGAWWRLRIWL